MHKNCSDKEICKYKVRCNGKNTILPIVQKCLMKRFAAFATEPQTKIVNLSVQIAPKNCSDEVGKAAK